MPHTRHPTWYQGALLAAAAASGTPAAAITVGLINTFSAGDVAGWDSGGRNPTPPAVVTGGGPAGVADNYLLLTASGGGGPGSRLVAFAGTDWSGNYTAAGVSGITLDVANFGATDLQLWLSLSGVGGSATTLHGVPVAAGSGWHTVQFALAPAELAGAGAAVLANVASLRLFHDTSGGSPPVAVAASLGLDNITAVSAVPEPAGAALLCAGATLLALRGGRRRPLRGARLAGLALLAALAGLGGAARAATALLPAIPLGNIALQLNPLATGLSAPDYAISAPGDASRLFVLEQNGLLRVIANGSLLATPALDLRAQVQPPLNASNANDERGLLGLAFHPGYSNPASAGFGTLYTYTSEAIPAGTSPTYAAPNGALQNYRNVVSEWKIDPANASRVDPGSRRELISFGKNAGNHNGGTLAFGGDGYLYLGLGDGGNANDVGASHLSPDGNAQSLATPLGKMLRIDPLNPALTAGSANTISANGQYRIPVSNPFQGAGQVPEVYAYGFRNPYRFSVDRTDLGGNGQIIVADVGQNNIEEIDRLQLGGNFGWALKEGDFLFNRSGAAAGTVGARSAGSPAGLIDPISGALGTLEYDHTNGISITGGFVYRGSAIAGLGGKFVFGDLALRGTPVRADGRLFYADLDTGLIQEFLLPQFANGHLPDGLTVHGFGEDATGELVALVTNSNANGTGGIVYQLAAVPEPASAALLGLGGLLVLGAARRRRAAAPAQAVATAPLP